jgi:hypothetical protein
MYTYPPTRCKGGSAVAVAPGAAVGAGAAAAAAVLPTARWTAPSLTAEFIDVQVRKKSPVFKPLTDRLHNKQTRKRKKAAGVNTGQALQLGPQCCKLQTHHVADMTVDVKARLFPVVDMLDGEHTYWCARRNWVIRPASEEPRWATFAFMKAFHSSDPAFTEEKLLPQPDVADKDGQVYNDAFFLHKADRPYGGRPGCLYQPTIDAFNRLNVTVTEQGYFRSLLELICEQNEAPLTQAYIAGLPTTVIEVQVAPRAKKRQAWHFYVDSRLAVVAAANDGNDYIANIQILSAEWRTLDSAAKRGFEQQANAAYATAERELAAGRSATDTDTGARAAESTAWTEEENHELCDLRAEQDGGTPWAQVATAFDGRSADECEQQFMALEETP